MYGREYLEEKDAQFWHEHLEGALSLIPDDQRAEALSRLARAHGYTRLQSPLATGLGSLDPLAAQFRNAGGAVMGPYQQQPFWVPGTGALVF